MKKILLVEDDPITGLVYQRGLAKHDFTIDLATDGAKGLDRLSAFQPDAIVLDLMMPKIGGVEFLKQLRAQEGFRDLPVVVLTNACVPAFIDLATKAGANQVMDKSRATPVAIAELLYEILNLGSENSAAAA